MYSYAIAPCECIFPFAIALQFTGTVHLENDVFGGYWYCNLK
jgi:hypothetical protein